MEWGFKYINSPLTSLIERNESAQTGHTAISVNEGSAPQSATTAADGACCSIAQSERRAVERRSK